MLIPLEQVNNFVFEHFANVKVSKNGTHFLARCSLCGDSKLRQSKRRFNLDFNNGEPIYQCFNCGRSGNFIQLYAQINGITYDNAKKEFRKFDVNSIKKSFSTTPLKRVIVAKTKPTYMDYILNDCVGLNDLPSSGMVQIQYQKKLAEFIKERNIFNYKLYIAYQGRYKGRIIIPIWEDGHIIYFQARTVINDEKKYDNPPIEKSQIIFNKDKLDMKKYVIITEGIFDALTIGNQGTTCLGASISDDFLDRIYEMSPLGVIVALDNDDRGIDETEKLIEESKYSNKLKYFIMPREFSNYKDINMMYGKITDIYDFIVRNSHNKFKCSALLNLRRKK